MILWISLVTMLALTGFFYLHIKEDYRHLVMLNKDEAYQLSDIIKRSTKHDMLLNRRVDLQQRVDDIANHDEIVKIRIIEAGRVKISSPKNEIGQVLDKKAEGCNECHRQNGQPQSSARENYRIFKNANGQEVIDIMNPIYNETSCYACHGSQKKILGLLDITISLYRVNVFMKAERNRVVLFLVFTFILISITVSLLIRHFVIVPFHRLTKETAMITFGNLDHQIRIDSGDEIGDLAEAFNLLTSKLKASSQEVEDKIRAATSRLAAANKELESANQKLEESDRKKSEMMMAVAHDVRAPLAAIESCLRVVLDGYLKNDPIKEREMLQRVEARIEDQRALVKNLLDFSLIMEDRCGEMTKVDLSAVIRKVMDLMSQLAKAKKISIIEVQEETEDGTQVGAEAGYVDGAEDRAEDRAEARAKGRSEDGAEDRSDVGAEGGSGDGAEDRAGAGTDVGAEGESEDGSVVEAEKGFVDEAESGSPDGAKVRAEGRAKGRSVDGAADGAEGKAKGGSVHGATDGAEGRAKGRSVDGATGGAEGRAKGRSVDGATDGAEGKAKGRVEPIFVKGDEGLLVRALTNLVDNSMKYSPPKSNIWISSRRIDSDRIQLAVRDNGPGIAEDELPLIFDFLFRGSNAKRLKKHGSGLGLAIVKQIVDAHKGEIRVESTEEGSSFFITLPRG